MSCSPELCPICAPREKRADDDAHAGWTTAHGPRDTQSISMPWLTELWLFLRHAFARPVLDSRGNRRTR